MSDWPVRLVFALRWKDFISLAIEKGKENLQEVFDRVKWLILAVEYLKGLQGRSIRHQNVCVCSCMSCFFTVVIPTALDKNGALIIYHTLVILFPINTSIESYSSQVRVYHPKSPITMPCVRVKYFHCSQFSAVRVRVKMAANVFRKTIRINASVLRATVVHTASKKPRQVKVVRILLSFHTIVKKHRTKWIIIIITIIIAKWNRRNFYLVYKTYGFS